MQRMFGEIDQFLNEAVRESEMKEILEDITTAFRELEDKLGTVISNDRGITKQEIESIRVLIAEIKDELSEALSDEKTERETKHGEIMNGMEKRMEEIESKIPEIPNHEDRFMSLEEGLKNVPPQLMAEEVRDRLELLLDDERLDVSAIKGVDTLIEKLAKKTGTVVGGVTNARIQQAFKYILKTESPVGDIDGVNTTYTVSQPIFAILSLSLNGETIAQLPNYVISGNTFVFSTALPVDYSGSDFECKYI